jgi:hypothetical protein
MPNRRILRSFVALVTIVAAALLLCSSPAANAVINGQPDGEQHPNVGLIVGFDSQGRGIYACTGTLIAPTIVLTAAHCVGGEDFGVPIAEIRVDFDDHLRQNSDGFYVIENFVRGAGSWNPLFQDMPVSAGSGGTAAFLANAAYDIGLITLEKRADKVFPGVKPMPIAGAGSNEIYRTGNSKDLVLQVGYGVQRSGPTGQPSSYFIDFTRNQASVVPKKATDALLYIGGSPNDSTGYGAPCSGDSGSPVLRTGQIISLFTFGQSSCNNIGGGPRLDAGPARAWLHSNGLVP